TLARIATWSLANAKTLKLTPANRYGVRRSGGGIQKFSAPVPLRIPHIRKSRMSSRTPSRARRTDLQDNLADVRAGFHEPMSFRGRSEGEGRLNHGPNTPRFDERPDFLVHGLGDGALLLDTARAQGRTGKRQAPLHEERQVDLRPRAFEEGDLNEPPFHSQRLQVAREVVAAYHVQDHAHSAPTREFADDLNK